MSPANNFLPIRVKYVDFLIKDKLAAAASKDQQFHHQATLDDYLDFG